MCEPLISITKVWHGFNDIVLCTSVTCYLNLNNNSQHRFKSFNGQAYLQIQSSRRQADWGVNKMACTLGTCEG